MNNDKQKPGYLKLHEAGKLLERAKTVREMLAECLLCPRKCQVDRLKEARGVCKTGSLAMVSSYNAHFGEESPLVGSHGSGTIFFTHCNLGCVFCQNYEISHLGEGIAVSDEQLAGIMINLQDQGCHNINFVTPSHVVPQILAALSLAIEQGLCVPLIYNSSGYDSVETLRFLDGIVDIYMPDFKFWSADTAKQYCKAPDYPERARAAVKEMHRQVGDLDINTAGIAAKGLLVRHLVMPDGLDETREIMEFISREISPGTYVNVMDQYRPCGAADRLSPINRALSSEEYKIALRLAKDAGLSRLDQRDFAGLIRKLF